MPLNTNEPQPQPESTPPGSGKEQSETQTTRFDPPWPRGVAPATWTFDAITPHVVQILEAIRNRRYPVVLAGDVGRGKSCAAALIWSLFANGDRSPIFADCSALLGSIMDARTNDRGMTPMRLMSGVTHDMTEGAILTWLERAPLVVLDDVGSRDLTPPQVDALLKIVNTRFARPLVVTTNQTASNLPNAIGSRVASRLRAGAAFLMTGVDRRVVK